MSVFDDIRAVAGVRPHRVEYNGDILDNYFLHAARERGVRLPSSSSRSPDVYNFHGGAVMTPTAGTNENVCYADLVSLYPNIMRMLNIGPDTLIGTDLGASEYTTDDVVHSYVDPRPVKHVESGESWREYTDGEYKMVYSPSQNKVRWRDDWDRIEEAMTACYYVAPDVETSFLREQIEDLMDLKYLYEGGLYEAVKRIVNSVYGTCSALREDSASRFADWRIGESVTLAGRLVLYHTRDALLEQAADRGFGDTFVSHGDTDGIGISIPSARPRTEALDFAQDVAAHLNEDGYAQFCAETFAIDSDQNYMEVEIESLSPRVFIPAVDPSAGMDPWGRDADGTKKRYAEWVVWDEGEEVDDVSITGLEATRSDVADVTTEAQEMFAAAVTKNKIGLAKEELYPQLRDLYEDCVSDRPLGDLAKRSGIGQSLDQYGSEDRIAEQYARGAKYMNQHFGTTIGEGDKVQIFYVGDPSTLPAATYDAATAEDGRLVDVLAVEDPSDLPDGVDLDREKHVEKALTAPLKPLLRTMGWDWGEVIDRTEQVSLTEL